MLAGGAIKWKSQKQGMVESSSPKTKKIALLLANLKALFYQNFYTLVKIGIKRTRIFEDNECRGQLTKDDTLYDQPKHTDRKCQIIHDNAKINEIQG